MSGSLLKSLWARLVANNDNREALSSPTLSQTDIGEIMRREQYCYIVFFKLMNYLESEVVGIFVFICSAVLYFHDDFKKDYLKRENNLKGILIRKVFGK